MNRRQLLQSFAIISGHALFPSVLSSFVTGCKSADMSSYSPVFFSREEYVAITSIVDIILPATQTKSASQVNTQVFLDQVFSQCLTKDQQAVLKDGIQKLVTGFTQAKDKTEYIADIDKRAYANEENLAFFKTIKQYTMIGFFTSEEGETRASHYVKFPEGYKGDVRLDDHTLNYGTTFLHY